MFKKAKHISEARPRMYWLLVVTISLVVGVIIGSTSYNSFGAGTEKPFHQLLHEAMAVMDKAMEDAPMTDNPDRDFVAMMIPHHQGAVDMAKLELLYGKDPVLLRFAQEIIVTQGQEMEVMRTRLKQSKIE
jgi:uncharacterized protein (DUF305 family)